jgi:hypothetical protein
VKIKFNKAPMSYYKEENKRHKATHQYWVPLIITQELGYSQKKKRKKRDVENKNWVPLIIMIS